MIELVEFAKHEADILYEKLGHQNEHSEQFVGALKEALPEVLEVLSKHGVLDTASSASITSRYLSRLIATKPLTNIEAYETNPDEWMDTQDGSGCYQSRRSPSVFYSPLTGKYQDVSARYYHYGITGQSYTGRLCSMRPLKYFKSYMDVCGLTSKMCSTAEIEMPYYPMENATAIELKWQDLADFEVLERLGSYMEKVNAITDEIPDATDELIFKPTTILTLLIGDKEANTTYLCVLMLGGAAGYYVHPFLVDLCIRYDPNDKEYQDDYDEYINRMWSSITDIFYPYLRMCAEYEYVLYDIPMDDDDPTRRHWFIGHNCINTMEDEKIFNASFDRIIIQRNTKLINPKIMDLDDILNPNSDIYRTAEEHWLGTSGFPDYDRAPLVELMIKLVKRQFTSEESQ